MALKPEEFARRLVELRGPHPKEWAAKKVGVSVRQYARWEKGESDPHWSSVENVALAYGLNPYEFYGEVSDVEDGFATRLERLEAKADETLTLLRELVPLVAALEALLPPAQATGSSGRTRTARTR